MFLRRFTKEIKGKVYEDFNENNLQNNFKKPLKDISIKLFKVSDYKVNCEARENPLGGKVNCEARENPLGDKVNCEAREDPLWGDVKEDNKERFKILKHKHISTTKTDAFGKYKFVANPGIYSVNLDVDTLPLGKGVIEISKIIGIGRSGSIDFIVKDIDSVYINQDSLNINIGEDFSISPVAKDKDGNILTGRMDYYSLDKSLNFRSNMCSVSPKSLNELKTDLIIDIGRSKLKIPINITVPKVSIIDKINLSKRIGLIDEHKRIHTLINVLFNRSELPEEYHSQIPIKSGTRIIEEIKRYIDRIDADSNIVDRAKKYLKTHMPKLDRTYKSPSGYFNINYTLKGEHAVTSRTRNPRAVPSYIQKVGQAFDQAKTFTCTTRGFREPILEEGKKMYEVYVYDLKGKYGTTYSSQYFSEKSGRNKVASSFICIDNNYSAKKGFDKDRDECMKVTAAHEFFHGVEFAYNVDADLWWMEASATWNEDEVYTEINDYVRYIDSYFSATYTSLDETNYSGVIFAKFLSENYGGYNIIKRIWEAQSSGHSNSISAIDKVIREIDAQKNIGAIFNQFSAYNVNPSQYYKEGESWKTTAKSQHVYCEYPIASTQGQLNHLSSSYHLFRPITSQACQSLRIIVDGSDKADWGFILQKKNTEDKLYALTTITSDGKFNRAEITIEKFGEEFDEVYLISSNLEKTRDDLQYKYWASIIFTKEGA